MHKLSTYIIVVFLLVFFIALAVTSIWPNRKSPTTDELAHHIPVGYTLLSKWDFKMDTSHPPLSRYIVALPLKLFMKLNMPDDKNAWRREHREDFGRDFFYKYNNRPHKIIFLSRLAVVGVGVICGIVLFAWTRALYGESAALFALFLYSFSPNILAHTRLATTDMVTTCFMLLAVYSFWIFIKKPYFKNIIFAGICLGLAQLSKYTSLLLYPMFLLLLVFELCAGQQSVRKAIFIKVLVVFTISVFVLWAGYGFDTSPILKDAMRVQQKLGIIHNIITNIFPFWNERLSSKIDTFLLKIPFPLGTHFLGILGVIKHSYEGHGTYFLGKWSKYGNPFYFIVAFFIKTPIPTIIFLFTGLFISFKDKIKRNEMYILITITLFFIIASFSKLQLGLRYILPIYPFFFILGGRSVAFLKNRFLKLPIILLIVWYVFSALGIWPNYLSYFNELIGGPKNGYKYLRDSNIDWGQDLPALKKYLDKHGIRRVKLCYFGTADPDIYGIRYQDFDDDEFESYKKDIYAISAHFLDKAQWTNKIDPTGWAGHSIFIYDFTEEKSR